MLESLQRGGAPRTHFGSALDIVHGTDKGGSYFNPDLSLNSGYGLTRLNTYDPKENQEELLGGIAGDSRWWTRNERLHEYFNKYKDVPLDELDSLDPKLRLFIESYKKELNDPKYAIAAYKGREKAVNNDAILDRKAQNKYKKMRDPTIVANAIGIDRPTDATYAEADGFLPANAYDTPERAEIADALYAPQEVDVTEKKGEDVITPRLGAELGKEWAGVKKSFDINGRMKQWDAADKVQRHSGTQTERILKSTEGFQRTGDGSFIDTGMGKAYAGDGYRMRDRFHGTPERPAVYSDDYESLMEIGPLDKELKGNYDAVAALDAGDARSINNMTSRMILQDHGEGPWHHPMMNWQARKARGEVLDIPENAEAFAQQEQKGYEDAGKQMTRKAGLNKRDLDTAISEALLGENPKYDAVPSDDRLDTAMNVIKRLIESGAATFDDAINVVSYMMYDRPLKKSFDIDSAMASHDQSYSAEPIQRSGTEAFQRMGLFGAKRTPQ